MLRKVLKTIAALMVLVAFAQGLAGGKTLTEAPRKPAEIVMQHGTIPHKHH